MGQTSNAEPATVHASAIAVEGHGVLVRGESGSGKSSLVLALLIAGPDDCRLIADDRVVLTAEAGRLFAAPPEPLAGLIEVRGQGIFRQPYLSSAEIGLVVDFQPPELCSRLPAAEAAEVEIEGVRLRRMALPIGQADGWVRVLAAIRFPAVPV